MHIETFGKVAYMEPQILANPKFKYIKPSDIYSYGVLMWEISSAVSNTPEDYEKLYKKCWRQEPKQRPTIIEILEAFSNMGFRKSIKDESSEENDATSNNSDSESHVDNFSSENIQIDTIVELSANWNLWDKYQPDVITYGPGIPSISSIDYPTSIVHKD
ncbi:8134_t:CDS:2 [Funneliformis mosseae]|uniref:8134_t:CDS:1 n=1 Tax=Funneliformis mosseae TaxID=27381 RepID=A0A9N8VSU8_FUNMO|nr:8134_t:CDS:2 [Funneliformis mosseae]